EIVLREVTGLMIDGHRVRGVHTQSGDIFGDMVVVAAGEWSSRFGDWLEFDVPVRPLKGERLMLRYGGPPLPVLISSPKRGHMISRLDGLLSVGSTGGRDYDRKEPLPEYESNSGPTESARLELLQRAVDVFPELEDAELVEQLAGSRPLSPDRLPIIGPVPGWDGVMLATGHSTKGIHLGPITGRIVSELIVRKGNEVRADMDAFLPDRFAALAAEDIRAAGRGVEE
ncbi:MAG: FAD-binding oxidoreductase, partial [Chloroflexi bacterium]|nr:FAD-binding oxidoreductase [Chloroflexota bacterium]